MAEEDKNTLLATWGPWVIVVVAVLGGAVLLGDLLVHALQNLLTMILLGLGVVVLCMFLPVVVRLLRYLVWGADTAAIEANPIAQLEIGLQEHKNMISQMEERVAEANAYYSQLEGMIKSQRTLLSADDLADFQEQLTLLKQAGADLVATRDQEIRNHQQFQTAVTAAKAKFAMGRAFGKASSAMRYNVQTGQAARDNQVALDAVNRQLAQGLSRMQLALSRPKPGGELRAAPVAPALPALAPRIPKN